MVSCVDRTQDFNRFLARYSQNNANIHQASASSFSPQMSEFNSAASKIGQAIHKTSEKVENLGKMSRGKGLFNDKSHQIQELQTTVQREISALSASINQVETMAASSGSAHAQKHSTNLVEALKTRFCSLTNDFKSVLELRTKTLAQQNNKMNMYRPNPMNYTANPADPESGGMQDQTMEVVHSRAESIKKVQAMIGDMGQMFQKMAVMVQQQEEMIMRVDQNIEDSVENIQKGNDQLMKYYSTVSNNRMLILKVFGVLIAFIVFFILFLA